MPPRTGTGAPRHRVYLCRCGCAGDSDHADSGADNRRTETESRSSASPRTAASAKHSPDQCLGIAGDFNSVRIHRRQVCPSACRSSDRTGEKQGSCSSPTPTNRRPPGTSANPCHPERRLLLRNAKQSGVEGPLLRRTVCQTSSECIFTFRNGCFDSVRRSQRPIRLLSMTDQFSALSMNPASSFFIFFRPSIGR